MPQLDPNLQRLLLVWLSCRNWSPSCELEESSSAKFLGMSVIEFVNVTCMYLFTNFFYNVTMKKKNIGLITYLIERVKLIILHWFSSVVNVKTELASDDFEAFQI